MTRKRPSRRLFAWWYLALAIGFALLGIVYIILHDRPLLIGLRFILAAGFGFLSWWEFSSKKRA